MQNPFKEFLYFSQGERRGILVLITGIILVFLSGYIYGSYIPPDPKPGGYNLCL